MVPLGRLGLLCALAVCVALDDASAASGGPQRTMDLVSGAKSRPAYFDGASRDGARVYFDTQARLTGDDRGEEWDLYRWWRGRLERISQGLGGGHADAVDASPNQVIGTFLTESRDGRRVLFTTDRRLTSDDRNFSLDTYEWTRRAVRLLSTRRAGATGPRKDVYFTGASSDLRRLLLTTDQRLTPNDRDNDYDVYLRTRNATVLLSPPGRGCEPPCRAGGGLKRPAAGAGPHARSSRAR